MGQPLHPVFLKIPVYPGKPVLKGAIQRSHSKWNERKVVSLYILPIPLFQTPRSGLCNLKAVGTEFWEVVA